MISASTSTKFMKFLITFRISLFAKRRICHLSSSFVNTLIFNLLKAKLNFPSYDIKIMKIQMLIQGLLFSNLNTS